MKPIYSEYEAEIVKKYFPIYGVKKCQEFIKRSAVSITQKARAFNIRRVEGWRENQTPLDEIVDLEDPKFCYAQRF